MNRVCQKIERGRSEGGSGSFRRDRPRRPLSRQVVLIVLAFLWGGLPPGLCQEGLPLRGLSIPEQIQRLEDQIYDKLLEGAVPEVVPLMLEVYRLNPERSDLALEAAKILLDQDRHLESLDLLETIEQSGDSEAKRRVQDLRQEIERKRARLAARSRPKPLPPPPEAGPGSPRAPGLRPRDSYGALLAPEAQLE